MFVLLNQLEYLVGDFTSELPFPVVPADLDLMCDDKAESPQLGASVDLNSPPHHIA